MTGGAIGAKASNMKFIRGTGGFPMTRNGDVGLGADWWKGPVNDVERDAAAQEMIIVGKRYCGDGGK
jgi:hypothetical protein